MDVLPEGQIKLPKRKTLTLTLRVTLVLIVTLVIFLDLCQVPFALFIQ